MGGEDVNEDEEDATAEKQAFSDEQTAMEEAGLIPPPKGILSFILHNFNFLIFLLICRNLILPNIDLCGVYCIAFHDKTFLVGEFQRMKKRALKRAKKMQTSRSTNISATRISTALWSSKKRVFSGQETRRLPPNIERKSITFQDTRREKNLFASQLPSLAKSCSQRSRLARV